MIEENHPEYKCNDCQALNPCWYAPSELWNQVCGREEIICPKCFQDRMDEKGIIIMITAELI